MVSGRRQESAPLDPPPSSRPERSTLLGGLRRFIFPYLRPYRWHVAAGVLLIPLSTFSALAIPRLMGDAVDILEGSSQGIPPGARPPWDARITTIATWILTYAGLRAAGLFGARFLIIGASRRIEFDLRNRLFTHLLSLDRSFYQATRTGDIMTRATLDVDAARTLAGPVIMYAVNCALMLALAIPLMLSVSVPLTLLVMIPLSGLTVAVRLIGPRVHTATRLAQETLSRIGSFAQENFGGIRVVKAYSMEERQRAGFRRLGQTYCERSLAVERISNWMGPIAGSMGEVAMLILMVAGGRAILQGGLSLGEFVTFSGYQALLIWPMISIGWVVNQIYRGIASIERLEQVFSHRSRVETAGESGPAVDLPERFRGEIEIRRLSFSFEGREVLHDIDMEIPAGSTVAILGRTGAGKSTLVSLIPRLHPVPDGTIFLDGIDINRIPLPVLRRAVGFVPQDTFLFSRSIAENIAVGAWGGGDADTLEDRIRSWGMVARFDKDLDQLSRGYEEVVGERGVTLSGGQRQRVAIARALIGEASVIVLDDALSAVDTQTEEEILRNLRRELEGVTMIIVSHRISSITSADRIYVLDDGRITGSGTHAELVERGGLYAELYRQQRLADELEEM